MNLKTLYLCYFGLREPLVQTQVLPYIREIVKGGASAHLLTFETNPRETWTDADVAEMRRKLAGEGIDWHFLTYHKRPSAPATLFDVLCGAWKARRIAVREGIDVFHARVHTPAMMGAIAKAFIFGKRKPKLLFDIRGFFPEEYVDAGIWPADGRLYRAVKRCEKWLLGASDAFVVLTERAREILFPESAGDGYDKEGRPVEVIPCCVDISRFDIDGDAARARVRSDLGIGERPVVVYVGALGGWYLTEETALFYGELRKRFPDAFALVLTQSDPAKIEALLRGEGYGDADFFIRKVPPSEIPGYLYASDAAVSFIKPCYSKQASSPTKNAEYLACGLPMVVNDGVGDTTLLTEADDVGIVIRDLSRAGMSAAVAELEKIWSDRPAAAERSRASAKMRFDLNGVGGERYRRLYRRLAEGSR